MTSEMCRSSYVFLIARFDLRCGGGALRRSVHVGTRTRVHRVVGHPVQVSVHSGIHSGPVRLGASLAPGDHSWKTRDDVQGGVVIRFDETVVRAVVEEVTRSDDGRVARSGNGNVWSGSRDRGTVRGSRRTRT